MSSPTRNSSHEHDTQEVTSDTSIVLGDAAGNGKSRLISINKSMPLTTVEICQQTKRRRVNRETLKYFCVFATILSLPYFIILYFGQTRSSNLSGNC